MGVIERLFGDGQQEHNSALVRLRQPIYDEAVSTAMKVDAVYHVATHAMERMIDLDHHRRQLAGTELQNQILVEFQLVAINKTRRIVHGMGDAFRVGW